MNTVHADSQRPCSVMALIVACVLLAACTTYGPQSVPPGSGMAQVLERLGPATARPAPLPDQPQASSRLEFARGPMGKHTYMLDFDAQGRMLRWEQVLTEARFFQVAPGWSESQVRAQLGTPSHVRAVGWRGETVWSYRYESPFCVWFEISLVNAAVVSAGNGPDPACEGKADWQVD
jgi:hypothetical protein